VSAIAGLFFRDGRNADPAVVAGMASRQAHRVPEFSIWTDGPVGLAAGAGGAIVVAADARIDNREDLAARLLPGRPLEAITDDALIVEAYRRWGAGAPERLLGDFAFAIWDRERGTLFCARDPFGARPFCYHLSDRLFAFATESRPLFSLPEVPRALDEVQVAFFLDDFLDDPERTFYREIRRLPAAHFLEVTREDVRMGKYWEPDADREVRLSSDDEYAEAFREIFLRAVDARLRAADPVAAALSGGLDSSSIVCAARRILPPDRPVHAFAAVFPGLPEEGRVSNDESEFVEAVAATPGISLHRVRADLLAPLADYDRLLGHLDYPPMGFNLYMTRAVFEAARREGARVFLDGTDGDSVVSNGYERFIDLANEGRWTTAVEEVEALTVRCESPRNWFPRFLLYPQLVRLARSGEWGNWFRGWNAIATGPRSRLALLLRYGIQPVLPRRLSVPPSGGPDANGAPRSFLRGEFAARTRLRERKRELRPNAGQARSAREDHARVLALPRYQYGLELLDGVASASGIVPRFPFFDRRLVEFCIAIPAEQKLDDGWSRLIQRRGMEGILPPAVQWRVHKGNLGFNFVTGMREIEAPGLERDLFGDPSILEDFVDMDGLRSRYRRFVAPEPTPEVGKDALVLYKAAVLARWLRDHGPP
jgi:asparagine synthase (glutamine-hydrolysing)